MKVRIKRQDTPESEPYWQTFLYENSEPDTVAGILEELNYRDDPTDENGRPCRRIRWECGCMQNMCGACAMVINHEPGLACGVFIDPGRVEELVLEPLSKFPVLTDLCVDRSGIHENLRRAEAYLGTLTERAPKEFQNQYSASKCLKCGLCLEVCPNYKSGENFFGAVWANEAYLLTSSTADRRKALKKQYRKHFAAGCSRSLACRDICPMKIPTLSSIGYMNRLF